jgi:hypothetical protein
VLAQIVADRMPACFTNTSRYTGSRSTATASLCRDIEPQSKGAGEQALVGHPLWLRLLGTKAWGWHFRMPLGSSVLRLSSSLCRMICTYGLILEMGVSRCQNGDGRVPGGGRGPLPLWWNRRRSGWRRRSEGEAGGSVNLMGVELYVPRKQFAAIIARNCSQPSVFCLCMASGSLNYISVVFHMDAYLYSV